MKRRLFITNRNGTIFAELTGHTAGGHVPVIRDAQGGGSAGFALDKRKTALAGELREVARELQVWDEYEDGTWRCEHAGPLLLEPSKSKGATWSWTSSHVGWYTGGRLVPGAPPYEGPEWEDLSLSSVFRRPARTYAETPQTWSLADDIIGPSCDDLNIEAASSDSIDVTPAEATDKKLSEWFDLIRKRGFDVDIMVYGEAEDEASIDTESVVRHARISPGTEWGSPLITLRLSEGEGSPGGANMLSVDVSPTASAITKMTMVSPEGLRSSEMIDLYDGLVLEDIGTGSSGADVTQLQYEALAEISRRVALEAKAKVVGNALKAQIYDRVMTLLPAGTAYSFQTEMFMQVTGRSKLPGKADLTLSGGLI